MKDNIDVEIEAAESLAAEEDERARKWERDFQATGIESFGRYADRHAHKAQAARNAAAYLRRVKRLGQIRQ